VDRSGQGYDYRGSEIKLRPPSLDAASVYVIFATFEVKMLTVKVTRVTISILACSDLINRDKATKL